MKPTNLHTKASLREHMNKTLDDIIKNNPDKLVKASTIICENIKALQFYKRMDSLLVYWPMENEVNIKPVIEDAWKIDKTIYFVYYNVKNHEETHFYTHPNIKSLSETTKIKYFTKHAKLDDMWSPNLDVPGWIKWQNHPSLIIVPTLLYNTKKQRIGKGFGCYDYFMNTYKLDLKKVGCAFNFQKTNATWTDQMDHDVDLDMIITNEL